MDFGFTPEQESLQSTLHDFGRRERAPHYASRDADRDLPRELIRQLGAIELVEMYH